MLKKGEFFAIFGEMRGENEVIQEKTTKELEHELSGCASLAHYLTENQECVMQEQLLSETLGNIMKQMSLRRADVIKNSGLNDIYVHQILAGKRHPSRNKLLCLLFGMELDAECVQRVLKRCGYAPLYAKSRRDSIILFALKNGHTLLQFNETLFEYGEEMIS